jgi:hypothetical protein
MTDVSPWVDTYKSPWIFATAWTGPWFRKRVRNQSEPVTSMVPRDMTDISVRMDTYISPWIVVTTVATAWTGARFCRATFGTSTA